MSNRSTAEEQFRHIANQYVAVDGALLRSEAAAMAQQNVQYVMPRADRRVRELIQAKKRKQFWRIAAAVAACVLIVLSLPVVLQSRQKDAESEHASMQSSELMPLSFDLPGNFHVADTEVDDGKSIYYLAEARNDDVVLTMESWNGNQEDFSGYTEIQINGSAAYIETKADYQLVLFEKEGILYNLTCQYEINTLIVLSETIL